MVNSIPTVLIPAWQRALRSRKRRGSVACTEQGQMSGITRSDLLVRVSRIWLGCISDDETQRGLTATLCHTVIKVAHQFGHADVTWLHVNQSNWRTSNEEANGVESQPKYDAGSHYVNMGFPKLVDVSSVDQYGNGVSIVPKGWPVMGSAIGKQTNPSTNYKVTVMGPKDLCPGGKGNSFCIRFNSRKEDC